MFVKDTALIRGVFLFVAHEIDYVNLFPPRHIDRLSRSAVQIIRIPVAEANIGAFNKPSVARFHAALVIILRSIFYMIGVGKDSVKDPLVLV